jgi:TolB-like protein/class 3 adenylate cyclase
MSETNRKLATILATDCVNFSRHMEESEEKTLRNLNECRKIIDKKISEYGGKIFSTAGDSVVAEFASPVQCSNAAIDFQNELYKRNDHSITELKLEWRVGIHVDDVIVEENNIMGSGVNVAARLESQCKPGEILVSKIVNDQCNKRVDIKIIADGTRELKNISDSFEVFKFEGLLIHEDEFLTDNQQEIKNSSNENILVSKNIEKSKKVKLAILPFDNLSKDDDSEFLVEGVFRDLIQEFSRMQEFEVISHQTSLDFKKSDLDAMSFANKNNVDYLIGGNVRSSGKRIRISVDLTDASDGSILWGEKYDRVIEDIFDLQDEIVLKMSRQLLGNIEISSLQRIKRKPSENLNSYEWLIRGTYHHVRSGKENNLKAIDSFEQAIKLDSSNARAHALKACTIGGGLGKNFYEDNEKKWNELLYHVDKSLEADENDFEIQRISSAIALSNKNFTKALEHGKKGYSINPNDPRILNQYGKVLVKSDDVGEGLKHFHKVLELDPIPQGKSTSCERYDALSVGYFCNEDYEKCIYWGEKIEYIEVTTWLMVLYSISENEDLSKVKESAIFKKYENDFKETDWDKTIDGINFRPEDEKNKILLTFSNKIFPPIKIVEKTA